MDIVCWFKVGAFYELYEDDATVGHQVFGLTVTYTGVGKCKQVGIPEKKLESFCHQLVALGHRVGVIEEVPHSGVVEPKNKKLKKDRVLREVFTPATHPCPGTASASTLLTVVEDGDEIGVCLVEAASASFTLFGFKDDARRSQLATIIAKGSPAEVLSQGVTGLSQPALRLLRTTTPTGGMHTRPHSDFCGGEDAYKRLMEAQRDGIRLNSLPPPSDGGVLGGLAWSAFGACLKHLDRMLLGDELLHQANIKIEVAVGEGKGGVEQAKITDAAAEGGDVMAMNSATLEALEVNTGGRKGQGLIAEPLMQAALTPFGKRRLLRSVMEPPCTGEVIRARQDAVDSLLDEPERRNKIAEILGGLPDLERTSVRVQSAARSSGQPLKRRAKRDAETFLSTIQGLKRIGALPDAISGVSPLLDRIAKRFPTRQSGSGSGDLMQYLTVLGGYQKGQGELEPPADLDSAYDGAIEAQEEAIEALEDWLAVERNNTGIKSLKFSPGGKYLVEVPSSVKKMDLPKSYEVKTSNKNMSKYLVPHIVKVLLPRLALAEETLAIASSTAIQKLYMCFAEEQSAWKEMIDVAAEVDLLLSLAACSESRDGLPMVRPQVLVDNTHPTLEVTGGRYPWLEYDGTSYIPHDLSLGGGNPRAIILTGPNMGGKSTVMRESCLLVLLAQLGCRVPCTHMRFTPVDAILTRCGASDRIMRGESTFYVELAETSEILRAAGSRSLVIMDELGRGTSTHDGLAVASAVLRYLVDNARCLLLFSTHHSELAEMYEAEKDEVALYHMKCALDPDAGVIFLYQLEKGVCYDSRGAHVAKMANISAGIIANATARSKSLFKESLVKALGRASQTGDVPAMRHLQARLRGPGDGCIT